MEATKVLYIEMTDERKKHWSDVCDELQKLLKREFNSPVEAHAVLKLLLEGMEQTYDIKDSYLMKERMQ